MMKNEQNGGIIMENKKINKRVAAAAMIGLITLVLVLDPMMEASEESGAKMAQQKVTTKEISSLYQTDIYTTFEYDYSVPDYENEDNAWSYANTFNTYDVDGDLLNVTPSQQETPDPGDDFTYNYYMEAPDSWYESNGEPGCVTTLHLTYTYPEVVDNVPTISQSTDVEAVTEGSEVVYRIVCKE